MLRQRTFALKLAIAAAMMMIPGTEAALARYVRIFDLQTYVSEYVVKKTAKNKQVQLLINTSLHESTLYLHLDLAQGIWIFFVLHGGIALVY